MRTKDESLSFLYWLSFSDTFDFRSAKIGHDGQTNI